jgi:PKD repeat protein
VLEWADAVLKAHPHRRAIVTSHWIVNTGFPATFSTQGRAIYDHLKNNPNLFLMLCGHVAGEGRRTDVFEGRAVHSVLQDYQGRANGGDGWLRTFTFSPARNTITARTYSPSLVRAELDADSDFTLPYDMTGAVTDWIPLGTIDLPAGATTATLSWTGLERGADFEWRAEVRDEINTTVSASRRFATAAAVPPAVELVAPAAGARIPIPATVRLAATVTSARPIVRVEFYRDNTKLGETRAAPYEFTWTNPAPGPYTLSTIAIDDTGAFTLSRLVNVTVFNAASAPPQVALTSPPAGTTALPGATLMLAANATDRDGSIVLVEFFNGAEKVGESRAAPFGFAWSPPAGNHTLTARATDNDGQSAVTAPVAVAVRDSAPGRVINFSVLAGVGPGNAAIIVGFVSGGVGTSGTKPLLVRALGPALAAFGVPSVTADSLAELYTGSAIVASNDNWAGNPTVVATAASVGAFPLADPGSRDAAFSATRPVGAHTIVVTGASGLALAELYDATPAASFTAATPRLLNVSARALVAPGSDSVHAGLVIGGTAARTLLIRAIGPGLAAFGVTNALADPRLELFRTGSSAPIAANDDWAANPAITNSGGKAGAFALIPTSRDAAVLVTLAPGSYTLRVSAPTAATGAALIDVYEVP